MSENQPKRLILRTADALERDEDLDIDQVLSALAEAKASLQTTYQAYQRSCPPEAQLASEYMGDSVALFYGALTNLEEYIDCCEDELLILARSEAVQAGELLERALDWAESVANSNNPHQMY